MVTISETMQGLLRRWQHKGYAKKVSKKWRWRW